jgi:peptidoglycan hydrolase-like protein with peptidoglycan-binding domain
MNLIENIQRIKEMMGIITESVSDIKSILKIGSNGSEVEALQDLLGIYKDGNFGEQTKTCVQEFQKKMEIYDDGIVGNITKSKLKDLEDNKVEWIRPDFCNTNSKSIDVIKKVDDPEKEDNSQVELSSGDVILMGGLDTRSGDLNIDQQVKVLKNKLLNKTIIGFRYNNLQGVLAAIRKNPESYVVLFSAGCKYSSQVAKEIKYKDRLFIVESYAKSSGVFSSVNDAVSMGVPNKNVITGPVKVRGKGVVSGSTDTPSGVDHWGSLGYVTNFIK